MSIKLAVVAAFVALLKAIVDAYLPGFPISAELINTLILALLALAGVEVVPVLPGVRKLIQKAKSKGLW